MCIFKKLNNKYLVLIEVCIIMIVNLIHTIFGFLIKVTYFNTYDLFGSSPLFDLEINADCGSKSKIVLHQWGGRLKQELYWDDSIFPKTKYVVFDQQDITKLNKYNLCYKHVSYRDLLYNGQIIKKGSDCPSEYKKNCGRIDTLEQELCIKDTEQCPLYDLGIGSPPDTANYTYDAKSNIYYNNANYDKTDKTIIGRLILNEGQPCLNSTEKLWTSFDKHEGFITHLKCTFVLPGKKNDDRYEERGTITYRRLYRDNLNTESKDLVLDNIKGDETVSLYRREFFGIDKECDSKYNLDENSYEGFKGSEEKDYLLLIIEGLLIVCIGVGFLAFAIIAVCSDDDDNEYYVFNIVGYGLFTAMLIACFICQAVFYARVARYNLDGYNCSDALTNEIIKKGTENMKKSFVYIQVNFYLELILFVGNCVLTLLDLILKLCEDYLPQKVEEKPKPKVKKSSDFIEEVPSDIPENPNPDVPLNTYYPNPNVS